MKHGILILLLLISILSCKEEKKLLVDENIILWSRFLSTLETKDKIAFKKASSKTIRCYDCLENTPAEEQKMTILRDTDSLWFELIYDDLIYIPIDSFIKNDFDLLFNPQFINILQKKEPIIFKDQEAEVEHLTILVTTTEPSANFEGAQHSFLFKKINNMWMFSEIGTIP